MATDDSFCVKVGNARCLVLGNKSPIPISLQEETPLFLSIKVSFNLRVTQARPRGVRLSPDSSLPDRFGLRLSRV